MDTLKDYFSDLSKSAIGLLIIAFVPIVIHNIGIWPIHDGILNFCMGIIMFSLFVIGIIILHEPRKANETESKHIRNTLKYTQGNAAQASQILGIDEEALQRKIRRYGLRDLLK